MSSLVLEYILFVALASCGVIQLVVARNKLRGLLFFHNRITTYVFSFLAVGFAYGWFFGWDNRLQEKIMHTGLEGAQQLLYFLVGSLVAVVATVVVSSVRNMQFRDEMCDGDEGLERLRKCSYWHAIRDSFSTGKERE